MAENITIKEGTRVRIDGQSYKTVEASETVGELVPVDAQTNRQVKIVCPSADCRAKREARTDMRRSHRHAGTHCRVSDLGALEATGFWPPCGQCGTPMQVPVKE